MDLERAIPRGRRGLQEWREQRIARIVHQNIDAAKRLDGALDHGLYLVLVRHVGLYRMTGSDTVSCHRRINEILAQTFPWWSAPNSPVATRRRYALSRNL